MNKLAKLIATGLGSGLMPFAPGTFGSIAAFLISIVLAHFGDDPLANIAHIILAIASYLIGWWAVARVTPEWGHDPGKIVIDEWCGLWIAYIFCPPHWIYLVLGLILFRLFDITKILGISRLDKIDGPHGVMLDDVLAGLYTGILLFGCYWFLDDMLMSII